MPFHADLQSALRNLSIRDEPQDARYLATYPHFVSFFSERIAVRSLREADAKIAVTLVYSWMGRAWLTYDPACWQAFDSAKTILPSCIEREASIDEIDAIRSFVSGDTRSLIATSKFLHFCAPERYAMWDQHVVRVAKRYAGGYRSDSPEDYRRYLSDLRSLPLPSDVRERVKLTIGNTSDLRAKEFALFHLGNSMLASGPRQLF